MFIFRARNEKAEQIKASLLENIYSYSRSLEKKKKSKALDKLITKGMDDESIWQQLELKNEESFQGHLKCVSRFLAANTEKFKLDLASLEGGEDEAEASDEEGSGEESENELQGSEAEQEEGSENDDSAGEEEDQDEADPYADDSEDEDERPRQSKKSHRKSIVDDKFFKLSDMEDFLIREDKRAMDPNMPDEVNLEIDMFEADDTNREEALKYADFFDDGEGESGDEEEESDEQPEEENGPKSSYELMQERLHKKIENMENQLLDDKPWQMKGEVKADNRPQNSLLEEFLEFDSTTRPAPIITEEVTFKLEDLIKQRIKDKAFDDVERKVKPSDIRIEYKKQLVLDQEKSKQSLAQIYEKEFIKELEKNNPDGDDEPEETKEQKEIRHELKDLFEKLDMLSNFHFTPRPAQPELKIITNLPTITMEEVAPVSHSDAAALAPEEIKRKFKGDVLGASERTKTDKKRERRHKKVFQREKFQKQANGTKSITDKVMKSKNVEKVRSF